MVVVVVAAGKGSPPAPAPANLMNPYQQQQQLPPSQPQNAGFAGGFQQPTGYQPMTPQPLQHATPQPPQPQTPEPPQPVQKGPIPADHQIIHNTNENWRMSAKS